MAQGEWRRTTELVERALHILEGIQPATIRQLFYQLLPTGLIANSRNGYQRVSFVMTKARNDGRVPFDYIVDRSRPEYSPCVFENLAGYARTVKRLYRKDYWAMQPNHVEIWTEKDTITGSIEEVTDSLGVTIRVSRGFSSTSKVHEIARQFAEIKKPIMVFFLGDFDPSGENIEDDIYRRVLAHGSGPFTLKRLAIFASDIRKFKLPPLRAKPDDTRTATFLKKHKSNKCVELDALPPTELRTRIREAVEELLDKELWERAVVAEQAEIRSIEEVVSAWPK